jgi:CRP/FNR family transcriptional regulator, cyclic AMP receptor protein
VASRLPYQPLPLKVSPGHTLLRQGDLGTTVWKVVTGAFVERVQDADGRSAVVDIAGPGACIGCVPGTPAPWEVKALGAGSVLPWDGPLDEAVARWTERSTAFACSAVWLDVPARLEARLEDLGTRFGVPAPGGVRIALPLTHDGLAELVGASRESVSRAISRFRSSGRIRTTGRGRIVVCRPLHVAPDMDRR